MGVRAPSHTACKTVTSPTLLESVCHLVPKALKTPIFLINNIFLLEIYSKSVSEETNVWTRLFIAAMFRAAKTWKQPKHRLGGVSWEIGSETELSGGSWGAARRSKWGREAGSRTSGKAGCSVSHWPGNLSQDPRRRSEQGWAFRVEPDWDKGGAATWCPCIYQSVSAAAPEGAVLWARCSLAKEGQSQDSAVSSRQQNLPCFFSTSCGCHKGTPVASS